MRVIESKETGDTRLVLHESAIPFQERDPLSLYPKELVESTKRMVEKWSKKDQAYFNANPYEHVLIRFMKKYK